MSQGLTAPRSQRVVAAFTLLLSLACSAAIAADKLTLDGSSGMLPLATALARAYQQRSSDPQVELGKGLGTRDRLHALADGRIQIALASHGLTSADVQKGNLKVIGVAKAAIVFAVNASVPLTDITEQQACDVYGGKVNNWQALGGSDQPMAVLTRPPAETDPEVIRDTLGCFKGLKEVETARVMPRGGDMAKGLAETPHAIGMTTMTVVEQSGGRVRALALNGVAATPENVRGGRYPLTRDFFFVLKGEPTPPVKKFVDFVLSADGDAVIRANGAVPLR